MVMATGVALAIALITLAVVMFVSAQETTKTAQSQFTDIQQELANTPYTIYEGTMVSGSQVVNALRKFTGAPQFGIRIDTRKGGSSWYFAVLDLSSKTSSTYGTVQSPASSSFAATTDPADPHYVNPAGTFAAQVIRDNSGVVHGLVFTQK